jgi:repressor LexA
MLTARQSEILQFIVSCRMLGYTPTVREIGLEFDILSPNGVACHLRALERKGCIHIHRKQARRIDVLSTVGDDVAETLWGRFEIGV